MAGLSCERSHPHDFLSLWVPAPLVVAPGAKLAVALTRLPSSRRRGRPGSSRSRSCIGLRITQRGDVGSLLCVAHQPAGVLLAQGTYPSCLVPVLAACLSEGDGDGEVVDEVVVDQLPPADVVSSSRPLLSL